MIQRIGRVALPPWFGFVPAGTVVALMIGLGLVWKPPEIRDISVAFIGNSMCYYNDVPRMMVELSDGHISQDSCLHGGADFTSILTSGNGMGNIWSTGSARINDNSDESKGLHDFGACTVHQLLFGYDDDLDQLIENDFDDDSYNNGEKKYGDDFFSYDDGSNPCLHSANYYYYLKSKYEAQGTPKFDYIVMNDNTRTPARRDGREESLNTLEQTYVPWILETEATPVFLCTYGYWTPYRDMGGWDSVAEFTSLTYEGYKQYAALLAENLPASQQPLIAPVGIAFLLVYEDNYPLWEKLFHIDKIHTSPLGAYLQGCVLHHTLFGRLPRSSVAVRPDMFTLWSNARRFQPGDHRRTPFPTKAEAAYLYHVAKRVCVFGHVPKSLEIYKNGEASDYEPVDDAYRVDDLF